LGKRRAGGNKTGAGGPSKLAERLHSAAIHLLRQLRKADEAAGVGPARLSALSVLVFGGPASLGGLARAEQVTPATMSRLVTGLERDGLARREADPDDRRAIRVLATAKGRRLLIQGRRRRLDILESRLAPLAAKERRTLEEATLLLEGLLREDVQTNPGPDKSGG